MGFGGGVWGGANAMEAALQPTVGNPTTDQVKLLSLIKHTGKNLLAGWALTSSPAALARPKKLPGLTCSRDVLSSQSIPREEELGPETFKRLHHPPHPSSLLPSLSAEQKGALMSASEMKQNRLA